VRPVRILAIVLRQFYLFRSSFTRVVPLFAWSVIDIILWGFITKYLNGIKTSQFDFVPIFLGAVLLWDYFTRVMFGITTTFFEDVWSRNFLNIFASPIKISEYLSGLVSSSILTSTVGLVVMVAVASFGFQLSFFGYGILFIPFILILFLFGIALGIFATAIVLRFGPASEWFVWPMPAILAPFAGVFYPLSTMPVPMQYLARILPPSYVFEGMRGVVAHEEVSIPLLAIGFGLVLIYIFLAGWCFSAVYRHALKTGLIARYSAETIN
jgi:ABC-2 type transport system permease protein